MVGHFADVLCVFEEEVVVVVWGGRIVCRSFGRLGRWTRLGDALGCHWGRRESRLWRGLAGRGRLGTGTTEEDVGFARFGFIIP